MRTLLTRYRFHHLRPVKERLNLPPQMVGRGLIDITRLYDKQVKLLQTYFLNKHVTSSLHAAVVKADDRCTPLDLVRANANELPTDEEYNNKVKRQWSQKALHARHPYDLSQQYVDIKASNKWLTNTDLFVKTEGFLTTVSHTNKKLQEIYFEAAKTPMSCAEDVEKNRRQFNTLLQHVSNWQLPSM